MDPAPSASVVIPTRARPGYLDVALRSIAPQAAEHGAEVLVVSDGPDHATAQVAARHGARLQALDRARGANAARNAGVAAARSELIVFVDDDVEAPAGWLAAILLGAREMPDVDVFGGPIVARLEGGGPHACGREGAPITTLDLGPSDRDTTLVWSANMAIRTAALERVGGFDETLRGRGEEEDWLRRHARLGGRVRYLAGAGLGHRRTAADATLRRLSGAAYALGRSARRYDVRKGEAGSTGPELRTLAGCLWHVARRRCAVGLVLAAHATGRLRETLTPVPLGPAPDDDFLSGESGYVAGLRAVGAARLADLAADLLRAPERRRLRRAARAGEGRRVLVLAIERTDTPNLLSAARAELMRSHHTVEVHTIDAASGGKFENLNALLARHPPAGYDWLIVLDDDVAMPHHFLDDFLFLAERFDFALAQPAHRRHSHAAWAVTRRRRTSVARQTAFVEIGPLTAFHARTFETLLPFPPLRVGWGLDAHWAAVAAARGWRIGVLDATAITHILRPIAAGYDRAGAIDEARGFLAGRPYVRAVEAQRTLVTHTRW
jgi:GT2 family glycosyltransferase